jgi:hypothetical protein
MMDMGNVIRKAHTTNFGYGFLAFSSSTLLLLSAMQSVDKNTKAITKGNTLNGYDIEANISSETSEPAGRIFLFRTPISKT